MSIQVLPGVKNLLITAICNSSASLALQRFQASVAPSINCKQVQVKLLPKEIIVFILTMLSPRCKCEEGKCIVTLQMQLDDLNIPWTSCQLTEYKQTRSLIITSLIITSLAMIRGCPIVKMSTCFRGHPNIPVHKVQNCPAITCQPVCTLISVIEFSVSCNFFLFSDVSLEM